MREMLGEAGRAAVTSALPWAAVVWALYVGGRIADGVDAINRRLETIERYAEQRASVGR